jgi:hypothetical protein
LIAGKPQEDTMTSPLQREFDYYVENQAKLVKKYTGQFVVIKNCKVIGAYDDRATAIAETAEKHEMGTFLVQKVEPGTASHTQTFHSRVDFATR